MATGGVKCGLEWGPELYTAGEIWSGTRRRSVKLESELSTADDAPDRFPRSSIVWLALLLTGVLVLHFAAEPVVLVCVSFAHFGWNDWRTGWWLWLRDPLPRRGRTWFWSFLAYGLLKVSAIAFVGGIALLFYLHNQKMPRELQATFWLSFIAWGCCALSTWIAMVRCSWLGDQVILDPAIHIARIGDNFPPRLSGRNRLPLIHLAGGVFVIFCGVPLLVIFGLILVDTLGPSLGLAAIMLGVVALAWLILWWNGFDRWQKADGECWPEYRDELGRSGN